MNKSNIYRIKNDKFDVLFGLLIRFCGVPEVSREMGIYIQNENDLNKEVHLKLKNRHCFFKMIDKTLGNKTLPIEFKIERRGVKSIARLVKLSGYKYGSVGEVLSLVFREKGKVLMEVLIGSFIGNIIYVYRDFNKKKLDELVGQLLEGGYVEEIDRTLIPQMVDNLNLQRVEIVDDLGIFDKKIFNFCRLTGIDVAEDSVTLGEQIELFNNNYQEFENCFRQVIGSDMLSKEHLADSSLYKPISIVIPSYNSEKTILRTLASIQSQKLPLELLRKTEVIVVDDASTKPVESVIGEYRDRIKTDLKIVRLVRNAGLSTARNIGLELARRDTVLFLDSDILISPNYLLEMSVRSSFIPNAVFVAFKQNIDLENQIISIESILKGLPDPDFSKDMRVSKKLMEKTVGVVSLERDKNIEILSETDYFKEFGFGRKVGVFDIQSMVIGHNICLRKKAVFRAGGFSNEFSGWGMEDSYFGARLIANRNFVIPVLSCGVYHINHSPRSGSEEKRQQEFKDNLKRYQELLRVPYEYD